MIKSAYIAKTLLFSQSRECLARESLLYKDHSEEAPVGDVLSLSGRDHTATDVVQSIVKPVVDDYVNGKV